MSIGKLKHTLGEKCPVCSSQLQLRVRDIPVIISGISGTTQEEVIICSNQSCEYERFPKKKKRRVKELDYEEIPVPTMRNYDKRRRKDS